MPKLVDDDDVEIVVRVPRSEYGPLAVDIILLALRDLDRSDERHRASAIMFFLGEDSSLMLWCEHAALNVDAVRSAVRSRLQAHERRRTQAAA